MSGLVLEVGMRVRWMSSVSCWWGANVRGLREQRQVAKWYRGNATGCVNPEGRWPLPGWGAVRDGAGDRVGGRAHRHSSPHPHSQGFLVQYFSQNGCPRIRSDPRPQRLTPDWSKPTKRLLFPSSHWFSRGHVTHSDQLDLREGYLGWVEGKTSKKHILHWF